MRGGSKLRNFINPCTNSLETCGFVIISGSGTAVTKVLNMKKKFIIVLMPIFLDALEMHMQQYSLYLILRWLVVQR